MMKQFFFYLTILMLALASCSEKTDQELGNKEISFVTSIATKVSATAFEDGDRLSIWAVEQGAGETVPVQIGGNFLNNELLTYDGTRWNAEQALYWSSKPCDFIAVYPYHANVTSVDSQVYTLPLDQNAAATDSTLCGYEAADIMCAYAENASRDDGAVLLDFHHVLAKCSVNVIKGDKFEGEIPDDIVMHIYNTTVDYTLDLNKRTVAKHPMGSRKTINMRKKDNMHFEAILVPQNIELSTPLIEVTMGGIAYLLNYSLSFKPGYNHTVNLTLNTSPDQEKIEIGVDPGIENWN